MCDSVMEPKTYWDNDGDGSEWMVDLCNVDSVR